MPDATATPKAALQGRSAPVMTLPDLAVGQTTCPAPHSFNQRRSDPFA